MSSIFALPKLYEDVKASFTADGITANVVFGRREPAKQVNQGTGRANRVVFSPGDESGNLRDFAPARSPGRNPRPLATLVEQCTVYCWAFNGTAPNNEQTQYEAARMLLDATLRAIYLAGRGTFKISKPRLVVPNYERIFGCEIAFTLTVEAKIPDAVREELATYPAVEVGLEEAGNTTTVTIPAEEPDEP